MGLNIWSIAQHKIFQEAYSSGLMTNALFEQQREREMDQGLCGQ
jgi:hypothetical protein